jgi:hypothetical protein
MIRRFTHLLRSGFLRLVAPAVFGVIVSASLSEAQRPVPVNSRQNTTRQQSSREQIVPPAFYPPAGMCRIWINQVPAAQQSAPTDCASAVRNRPSNGKVLFGDQPPKGKKNKTEKGNSNPADELLDLINRRISR